MKYLLSVLKKLDFFPSSQFLRYKGQPQYKTATGGFCSTVIIIIFIILFINTGLNVLNKKNVTVTSDIQHQADPTTSTLFTSPNDKFMFAVNVIGIGVFDSDNTNFNVTLQQSFYSRLGTVGNSTNIPLVACTAEHFNFSSEIIAQYYAYGYGGWLCPPLNFQFTTGGVITSSLFSQFSVYIKKCDSNAHSNCAPDSKISSYLATQGYLNAVIGIVTTQLNPSLNENYMSTYVEGRNIFPFSTSFGVRANAEVMDYEIDTDISLLPFTNTIVETVGLIFSIIFILNSYSQLCFQISLGNRLFKHTEKEQKSSISFNFLVYLCFIVYKMCAFFGCCSNFQMMKMYEQCQEEVEKQIDISIILQRISLLQRGMMTIIEPYQFQSLFFHERMTLVQAKEMRERLDIYQKFKRKENQQKDVEYNTKEPLDAFSNESSFSSIASQHYKSIQKQLIKLKTQKNTNPPNKFLAKLRKDVVANLIDFKDNEQDKLSHQMKSFIGEEYFREMQSNHLKNNSSAGWAKYRNYNKKDQL